MWARRGHAAGLEAPASAQLPARPREMRLKRLARQAPVACSSRTAFLAAVALVSLLLAIGITAGWRQAWLVRQLQADLADLRQRLQAQALPAASHGAGPGRLERGIVMCAGGPMLLANAYVSVHVLRRSLNSSLPIEIYHDGPADLPPGAGAAFQAFGGVSLVDLRRLPWPQRGRRPKRVHGYVQKVLSLYSTRFSQVLLLDADSQPLRDPALLFADPSFQRSGSLFWPDYWAPGFSESPQERVYSWLGLEPPWRTNPGWQCAETGQVLFDRLQHADVLEWLWLLNAHWKLLYKHMLGDKDTFEAAFMLAGKGAHYARVAHSPGLAASRLQQGVRRRSLWVRAFRPEAETSRYLRLGMLQFAPGGEPAFLHRTAHTKFAAKRGYSLDVMRVEWWAPPISAAKATEVRAAAWHLHSIPASLADPACSCCVPDAGAAAVLAKAGLGEIGRAGHVAACPDKIPLFAAPFLGPQANAAITAGFAAYRRFAALVPGLRHE